MPQMPPQSSRAGIAAHVNVEASPVARSFVLPEPPAQSTQEVGFAAAGVSRQNDRCTLSAGAHLPKGMQDQSKRLVIDGGNVGEFAGPRRLECRAAEWIRLKRDARFDSIWRKWRHNTCPNRR